MRLVNCLQTLANNLSCSASVPVQAAAVEFLLFGLMLLGMALFHRRTLEISLAALVLILIYKLSVPGLDLVAHLAHEWHLLLNLFGLLIGFAILTKHFQHGRREQSGCVLLA